MNQEARRTAKAHLVAQRQAGARDKPQPRVLASRTAAQPLTDCTSRVRTEGAVVLEDQRLGHPTNVREPVQ